MARSENIRLYTRVSDDLSRRIQGGQFAVGDRLPSERLLGLEYKVSRPTVREALFALELDGLIEVRVGAGIYVTALAPARGTAGTADVGPFELLEARRLFEGEACALAAGRISKEDLDDLAALLPQIDMERAGNDVDGSETADREFHTIIARASQNSAILATIEMLWDMRKRSQQYQFMSAKAHAAGVVPKLEEHRRIYEALKAGDARGARQAMQKHLSRVLESLMCATELHEMEQAKQRIAAQRKKFSLPVS